MNVLVIGSGGREHTLVWKISRSPKVSNIYCIPGNGGTGAGAQSAEIAVNDFEALTGFVKEKNVGLTVVGPEIPLVKGIVDYFQQKGLAIFGPDRKSAQLEGSKVFSKKFMKKHGIPTADFKVFSNAGDALSYVDGVRGDSFSVVIKADGLAAGKGVIVCDSKKEAADAVKRIMEAREFESAGDSIIMEDKLTGEEASMMAFCDGRTIVSMVSSQDHKQAFDGDKGPNTGGMGAYAPAPVVTEDINNKVKTQVFDKFLKGIREEKIDFKGIIYAGIMIDKGEVNVLEFNVRFGDPETQVVLPLLKTDIVEIMEAVVDGKLEDVKVEWNKGACVCVVVASGGYPARYEKGKLISGLEEASGIDGLTVFHAGTKLDGGVLSWGGRVLGVTGVTEDLKGAIELAYEGVGRIKFENMYYRKDIGWKGVKHGK